jgi:[acyl-carrier-protein] S-malonyltransferase
MSGLAILCPGQGGQHSAMFEHVARDPAAIKVLDSAARMLGWDPRERVRRDTELFVNAVAQPLVCSAILANWAALRPQLPPPCLFAGYSVGELAAYGCADALDVEQTLTLVQQRAALMDQAVSEPQGLLALRGLNPPQVRNLCRDQGAFIAITNGPDHFIVGGSMPSLGGVEDAARRLGGSYARRLPVSVAAHTPLMRAASARFRAALAESALKAPPTPVLAGINGALVHDRDTAITMLSEQLSTPLDWATCMQVACESGARVFLELEPDTALARLLRDVMPDVAVRSVKEFKTLAGVVEWVCRSLER